MKKIVSLMASCLMLSFLSFSANAQEFEVPEPTFAVPLGGEAELLYNMFEVTWGYYTIEDNMGDQPMTCTLTFPDGTVQTVKGIISDANMEGTIEDTPPSTHDNALLFRNFMQIDYDTMQIIQQYGTYLVNIPEGTVLVNGVPNPEANLSFRIIGEGSTDGIEKITDGNQEYKVFTIDGKRVVETPDINVIKNLKAGVYIINGKKTIIH